MQVSASLVATALLLSLVAPASVVAPASLATPASAGPCPFPTTVTDATGTEVTVDSEPARVVSLSPSAAQTTWEIGAREKVVGVTKYASYLEGAESKTNVSRDGRIVSYEAVVDLEPDLVLAPNATANATVERLRAAGETVYHFGEARTIEDVYEKTRRTGWLTGACAGGAETVSWMKERIAVASEASEGRERPDALYLFFGHTAGEGTFIDEIVRAAGGSNVAAEADLTGYPEMNPEAIVAADPDWLLTNSRDPVGVPDASLNRTTAVRGNQTVALRIEHVNQPAPRIVDAITRLSKRFHPEGYAAANATETAPGSSITDPVATTHSVAPTDPTTATDSPATSEEGTAAATTPTEGSGAPGFGPVLAIVGVATGLVLRSRRH